MERFLSEIQAALTPVVRHSAWAITADLAPDVLRLKITRASDGQPLFGVVLEPRLGPREQGSYATTARFYIYYNMSGPEGAVDPAAQEALLQQVVEAVTQAEARLAGDALERFFAGVAPSLRRDRARDEGDRTQEVAELGGPEAQQHVLRITFACNQRCPYCFVSLKTRRPDLQAIEDALDQMAAQSTSDTSICISGGEPTLDRRLPRIIEAAHARGLRKLELQTNAVRLADDRLVTRLLGYGVRDYFVSFHGHTARLYDHATGTTGQFPDALAGIRNLLAHPEIRVTLNLVISQSNYRSLLGYVTFVDRLGRSYDRRIPIFFSFMSGLGVRHAPDHAVALERLAPYLNRAVDRAQELGIPLSSFAGECAVPVCVVEELPEVLGVQRVDNRLVCYQDTVHDREGLGRVKRVACRECWFDDRCAGVPREYALRFGTDGLSPILSFRSAKK